jgi:UDP:flavonoid glycosyltransferase YjiC (YdhE family)
MVSTVEAADFAVFPMGEGAAGAPARLPLRPLDRQREERELRDRFARRAASCRVPLAIALCSEWQPDVLVCDETDFGAIVAAARLGLPYATVLVLATGSLVRSEVVAEALDALRVEHGLPSDPELSMLSRYLVLSPFPSSLRDPDCPLPATAYTFRAPLLGLAEGAEPAWSSVLPGAPTLYFTLGTIFNMESGDLLARVLRTLRELPVNLVVTVGHQIDPTEFGRQPANVHIERYIPHSSVLPHCELVVSHGGSGSVTGALAHGLPSVLIPIGADQAPNAERCVELGVARVVDAVEAAPEGVRAAVMKVLADAVYRRAAERVRDEIAALPELASIVGQLERVASERRPLSSA